MKTKRITKNNKENRKNKKIAIIIIVFILSVLLAFLLLYLNDFDFNSIISNSKPTPIYLEDEGSSLDGEVKTKSREEILEELKKQQLVVTDKLSSNITFSSEEAGTTGKWIVENPEENNIIQQAEVYFDNLLIAKSTPIYPNQHIEAIELLEEIAPGEYNVIACINYYDIETKEYISKAGYKVHLTIR